MTNNVFKLKDNLIDVDVFMLINKAFTNNFFLKAVQNIKEVAEYTANNSVYNIKNVFIVYTKKDLENRLFSIQEYKNTLDSSNSNYKFVEVEFTEFYDILEELKSKIESKYIALYGANSVWYNNHIIESIKSININKKEWSISNIEIWNDYNMKDHHILHIREPNPQSFLNNDVMIGEIVVKSDKYKEINFKRGISKEGTAEYYFPGYAFTSCIGEYAVTSMATTKYYMEYGAEAKLDFIDPSYKFDTSLIKPEHKDTIVFSVILNACNVKDYVYLEQSLLNIIEQQLPSENYEIILVGNYSSAVLFFNKDLFIKELQTKNPELKIPSIKPYVMSNRVIDAAGNMNSLAHTFGIQQAIGKYITYFECYENMGYTSVYLSELYIKYELTKDKTFKWVVTNYYDNVNEMARHSNIEVINKEQLYFTSFSHERLENIPISEFRILDNYVSRKDITLMNILLLTNSQHIEGALHNTALVFKLI